MTLPRRPAHSGIRPLAAALSLALSVPVLATTLESKSGVAVNKGNLAQTKAKRSSVTLQTAATSTSAASRTASETTQQRRVMVASPTGEPVTPIQPPAATADTPMAATSVAAAVADPTAAAAPQNPYLAGWYRPVPASALPAMAIQQLNDNARYVSEAVTSIPAKLADALPSIKTVHPTGGRDLVVASLKCPAEMMMGHSLAPADALREGVNSLLGKLNEKQWLNFDIQLVCR